MGYDVACASDHKTSSQNGPEPSVNVIALEMSVPWVFGFCGAIIKGSLNGENETDGESSNVSADDHIAFSQYEKSYRVLILSKAATRILPSPARRTCTV